MRNSFGMYKLVSYCKLTFRLSKVASELNTSPVLSTLAIDRTYSNSTWSRNELTNNVSRHRPLVDDNQVQIFIQQQRFAGHSKWQNIKSTKEANDSKKGLTSGKFALLLRKVARGNPDPKLNSKLQGVINEALKAGVTRATIDRALKSAAEQKSKRGITGILGPGGSIFLCDHETELLSDLRHNIKIAIKIAKG